MKKLKIYFYFLFLFLAVSTVYGQKNKSEANQKLLNSTVISALKFRSVGPAFASGRIADFAVNPKNFSEYYVAVASGNVWKTANAGITFTPIFDNYGSYSTADVEIDPNNSNVVWLGTGEYNSQRAIGYGDGVYKTEDGGKTWTNMGLKKSEHIGRIAIDPRNSDVYVAAQGPLWSEGGERGLYKTTDGGKSWKLILEISKNTGITDVVIDNNNPDIVYAASYQRRRHVFTLIDGGPESAIYKSTNAGASWEKLSTGLPKGDVGRIGLAISPANPAYIYAIIEAAEETGGFFRSIDFGASWTKMSSYVSNSPQYYNRIIADPDDCNKVFSMDTYSRYSLDGGKTFTNLSLDNRHVDDHALWINPENTNHLLIGGDGGIYESFDMGTLWRHIENLPVTQFYRVAVDNDFPFYNIIGGTQDNNSIGGPSQTISENGITNADWFVTVGGDGFESAIDPENPNIIYSQSQYGWLSRYDKKSGETIGIKPQPPAGEAYRWNWNSPLIISPHSASRLYFAANKLFKSNDRGNSWEVISPDLTKQLDRNTLEVMGTIQSVDAVAKNASTSLYGNIVSLAESPLKEGLLFVGTDDGLIQISENDGNEWTKYSKFEKVPESTYVSCITASNYDENIVYASFDNRKRGDFKPYLLKSTDKGKSWISISSNLPDNCPVFCIAEDHKTANLLFIGTEFGVYCSVDAGENWLKLSSGLPTIPVYDVAIQQRENDLVVATFGRGFYVLDNYSPLRTISEENLQNDFVLFEVRDPLMFVKSKANYGQGANFYKADNPEFGACFTYYLKSSLNTVKTERQKLESENKKNGIALLYPTEEEYRAEEDEISPMLIFTICNEKGTVIRKLKAPANAGMNRIYWDLTYPQILPAKKDSDPFKNDESSFFVLPGKYSVKVSQYYKGEVTEFANQQSFSVKTINNTTFSTENREELVNFANQSAELYASLTATSNYLEVLITNSVLMKEAVIATSTIPANYLLKIDAMNIDFTAIKRKLSGDETISKRNENQPPSLNERIGTVLYSLQNTSSSPTFTMKEQYEIVSAELKEINETLKTIVADKYMPIEQLLEENNAPYTPGRIPNWNK